jgi:hypothetical protein
MTSQCDNDIKLTDMEIEIFRHIFQLNNKGKFISTINNLSDILALGDTADHLYWNKMMPKDVDAIVSFKKDCPNLDSVISEMLYFYLESNCAFEICGEIVKKVNACI